MEILLNRWRGTGDLFSIGSFRITGTMLYVIYFIIFAYILSGSYVVALFTGAMFLAGESVGFGKWVGYLCYPEEKVLEKEYLDKEGYGFPYIHYIANFIAPERENFSAYCNTAIALRGLFWGAVLYLGLYIGEANIINAFVFIYNILPYFDILPYAVATNEITISLVTYMISILIWTIGFPLACLFSRYTKEKIIKNKFISINDRWESQEIYYGMFQMIANAVIVYTILY